MANLYQFLPEVIGEEQLFLSNITKEWDEAKMQQFANIYRARRKDPQTILLLTLVGFLGIAGIQRFMLDQIGMGILYLLTVGLCYIGTIVDLVNYKSLAFEYNVTQAQQVAAMLK